ncbi:hypothetical protein NYE50_04905 [Bacillus sp. EU55]|uniref:hypothetical protein n=1 Tax=Bacillus sp. EU55 TaxID=2975343 RepID=UPI0030F4F4BC
MAFRYQSLNVFKHEGFRLLSFNDFEIPPYEFTAFPVCSGTLTRNREVLAWRPSEYNVGIRQAVDIYCANIRLFNVIAEIVTVCFNGILIEVQRLHNIVAGRFKADCTESASAE